ncbi:MAG TPA: HAD-IA family hydrolase [Pseudonocardiaceae bacterium]|nr:HAD-IA family hydrolase [Pseudonocardiaceae bacterium]
MTTPPVDDPEALRHILGQADALFLDFDGPVCDLFAGLPASAVVDQLCVVLADGGYGDPPPEIEKSSDPFDVLKYAATLGETEADYVNAAFTALETEAVATARPTRGAHDLVRNWSSTGRQLAIVSNNSKAAVEAYLVLHDLGRFVAYVSARQWADSRLLKPSPHLLNDALRTLHFVASNAVFIGDSVSDIEAARAVGVMSIGYASKAAKIESLSVAGPAAVTTTMVGV